MNDLIRLRDEFAMAALQSIGTWIPVGFSNLRADESLKVRAEWAYRQADYMMDAREQDKSDGSSEQGVNFELAAKAAYERMTEQELKKLADAARARIEAMSPEDQAAHWEAQRRSFVRGMTTPCEHGELDYEQCPQCRAAVRL